MPAKGGLMTAHPVELLEQAKELYLEGKQWSEISQVTGIKVSTLQAKASIKGWTAIKQKSKEKTLSGLRPKLHAHLTQLVESSVLAKPARSVVALQDRANAVLTLTQAAKAVEGWQDSPNTLVNIAVLESAVTVEPEPTDKSILIPEQPTIDLDP
jgi:hypothetical protein